MSKLFLFIISLTAFYSNTMAFPITLFLGETPDPIFINKYYERLDKIYKQEISRPKNLLSPIEKDYISECKKTWTKLGVSEHPHHLFEYFSFRHKIQSAQPAESYFFVGLEKQNDQISSLINSILKIRGFPLNDQEKKLFFGFIWSSTNSSFSTVHLINSPELFPTQSPLKKIFENHSKDNWASMRLLVKTKYKNGATASSLHIPLKNNEHKTLPLSPLDVVSAVKIITDSNEVSWHYRLKSLPPFLISESIHPLIKKYNHEFNLYPHSIIYQDTNNFTLYYP
jgi:hypothetical protein